MIEVDGLGVAFEADAGLVRAVDALALSLRRGETFALVGESGCGKSATALALTRLLPDNGLIDAGEVRLDGVDVLALPERSMRAVRGGRIGMIFQEPATSLDPVMRVGRQVVEAIRTHTPLRGAAARARALEWLHRVGLDDPERCFDAYAFSLSGGQKQRVMIAIALAAEPEWLIADEPTTALDVTIQAQILALLGELQHQRRMGLLLITHDLAVVAGMAQRVALMYAGQIVEIAGAAEFFAGPCHPYARMLLRALPQAQHRGRALAAIAGSVPALTQGFTGCRFAARCDEALPHCADTPVAMFAQAPVAGDARAVRCLLHAEPHAGPALVRPPRSRPVVEAVPPSAGVAPPASATGVPPEAAAPAPTLLDVQDLRVRYPLRRGVLQRVHGYVDAVAGVCLRLVRGRTLALVGESGCGKTTLGKAVVQLLRGRAHIEGRALLDGRDLFTLHGAALREARRSVQIVFQDPFASLDPRRRVAEILEEGLIALRPDLHAAPRRARALDWLDRVGLARSALERYPHEFSGGQRQRIAIARALAVEPRLLICDEPTSALDVSVQAQILNLLTELQRETGVAYLFITHNLGVVEYLADEVAVMRQGRLEEQGCTAEVFAAPRSAYTRSLLDAVPRLASR